MFSFVQNFFTPRVNPIGVDFGTDCLRLAQVQCIGADHRLVAAASCDIPSHVRSSAPGRIAFFVDAIRDLLAQGSFRSRQAVLALPASMMHIQHLRLAKMDDAETRKAIPWEARGKLPIDPSAALIRHIIAGEVYQDQEPRNEVIVMAAARDLVAQLLDGAAKAKLDVIGMNVEPKALVDCFDHIYRRKVDGEATSCYVDIGSCATRVVIARGGQIYFARAIPIGGDHLTRAAATALKISFEEAKLLRIKICHAQTLAAAAAMEQANQTKPAPPAPVEAPVTPEPVETRAVSTEENSFALLGAAIQRSEHRHAAAPQPPAPILAPAPVAGAEAVVVPQLVGVNNEQVVNVERSYREPLRQLIDELDLCRRYYESTFPAKPVDRLIFVGGETRHRGLCQMIARQTGLAAQLGDPMVRMAKTAEIGIESGIDRRQPQPAWAVAIGLSLGPVGVEAARQLQTT